MHGGYGSGIGHRTGNHREGAIDETGMGTIDVIILTYKVIP